MTVAELMTKLAEFEEDYEVEFIVPGDDGGYPIEDIVFDPSNNTVYLLEGLQA